MTSISTILKDTSHRPWELPAGKWQYYQEWNNALFFHWAIPFDILRNYVPEKLELDTFNGQAYVSLVAFTMQKIRPRNLPSIACISDFNEINLRTYINNNHKKGVYFLNIEAEKSLSAFIAKQVSGLPYEKSTIKRTATKYNSSNLKKGFFLDTEFEIKEELQNKTELDKWLTERYCLYLAKDDKIYRYDIHHQEWELKDAEIKRLNLRYKKGSMDLINQPDLVHYSDGVKVLAWKRQEI
jgi:uncharacterized protein